MFFKSIFEETTCPFGFFRVKTIIFCLKRIALRLEAFFFEPGQRRLWWVCRWPVQYSREGAGCSMILGDSTRCVFFDPSYHVKIGNTPDLEGCPVDMKMEVLHKQFLESYCSPVWSKNSSSPFLPEYRIMEVKNGRSSTSNYLSYTAFFYFHDSGRESNHGSNRGSHCLMWHHVGVTCACCQLPMLIFDLILIEVGLGMEDSLNNWDKERWVTVHGTNPKIAKCRIISSK